MQKHSGVLITQPQKSYLTFSFSRCYHIPKMKKEIFAFGSSLKVHACFLKLLHALKGPHNMYGSLQIVAVLNARIKNRKRIWEIRWQLLRPAPWNAVHLGDCCHGSHFILGRNVRLAPGDPLSCSFQKISGAPFIPSRFTKVQRLHAAGCLVFGQVNEVTGTIWIPQSGGVQRGTLPAAQCSELLFACGALLNPWVLFLAHTNIQNSETTINVLTLKSNSVC